MSPAKGEKLIEVKGLEKHFKHVEVLRGINIDICKGDVVAVIGPSGSGKSTFLRCLNLLEEPTGGQIVFEGVDITSKETKIDQMRQKIGMVFQQFNLFTNMTVLDNVSAGPVLVKGMKRDEAHKLAQSLLERVGLGDRGGAYPIQLSGGQQQRVALARALVIEPSVLLFDEPLSNLDAKLRVTMRTEIRKIQQKVGITAIYVTHDQSEAMSISDKIIIMSKGKVEQIGTPREIYYHPNSRFVADFIGEANFLEARVRSASGEKAVIDVVGQELTVNNFAKAGPGDDAVLVIRPEGATLAEQGLLEGTVTLSTFMGSYQYYQVMVGNMEIQITDYNPVNRRIYEVGEKAYLDFDPKGVYIL